MPVAAISPGGHLPTDNLPAQPTFKYDKKDAKKGGKGGRRKQEAHFVRGEVVSEFAYATQAEEDTAEIEVIAVEIPLGMSILDTGCTAIGEDTAPKCDEFFRSRGLPSPEELQLPPVAGSLQWRPVIFTQGSEVDSHDRHFVGTNCDLCCSSFQEGLDATLDLGTCTLTSAKHGMHDVHLR